jgi:hypothetical protein
MRTRLAVFAEAANVSRKRTRSGAAGLLAAIAQDKKTDRTRPGRHRPNQAAIKAQLIAETCGRCQGCDVKLPDDSLLHVHHVTPIAMGGLDELGNAILACPNCHAIAHWLLRNATPGNVPTCPAHLIEQLRDVLRPQDAA